MAGGVPVAAYEGGGVHSIVKENTGVLTKRSPEDLGNAIRSLLMNDETRREMAADALTRARANYAREVLGPKLNDWLLHVISEA